MDQFSAFSIIAKKRDNKILTQEEIQWFIEGVTKGTVADYQIAALLMAIFIRGLNARETQFLTRSMLNSGKVLDFADSKVIDKHSTGGVGDKTSFILAAVAAACGVKVPMIAGRGLGHTGGTVDKIESIPGYRTQIDLDEFSKLLHKNGLVLIGQTSEIAPADKKIYALRDVTATINSIPLITASIMSKKLAEGNSGIVMDIKTGSGAFMKTLPEAKKLATSILSTAKNFKRKCTVFITDMSQPLGNKVGHSLEIIECLEVLKGYGPEDLKNVSLELAAAMMVQAKVAKNQKEALIKAQMAIDNGSALEKFKLLVKAQGGDIRYIENEELFDVAPNITQVLALKNGFIGSMDCEGIGNACVDLGGGRKVMSDKIDMGVGFYFYKKIGDPVKKGDPLVDIFHRPNQEEAAKKIAKNFQTSIIKIATKKIKKPKLILAKVEAK